MSGPNCQLRIGPLVAAAGDGLCWCRFLGYGIAVKDTSRHPLLFSERHGYTRRLQIGKWSVKALGKQP